MHYLRVARLVRRELTINIVIERALEHEPGTSTE
jgi:hypothetical protein